MRPPARFVGTDAEAVAVAHEVAARWEAAGLGGSFLARHLGSGRELGFDADRPLPLASVVKLPVALVVLAEIAAGRLAVDRPVRLDPRTSTPGPTGAAGFRHGSEIALEDLVHLMLSVSDNAAADAVLDLVQPARVSEVLTAWGFPELVVRHHVRGLYDAVLAVAGDLPMGLELTVRATTSGGGHAIEMLDVGRANAAPARTLVDLLAAVWRDEVATPDVTSRLRSMLARQLTGRFEPEVGSDAVAVAGKTGTFLNLRHEVAVVSTELGDEIAVAALTECEVVAMRYPEADLAIGAAARSALDALRA